MVGGFKRGRALLLALIMALIFSSNLFSIKTVIVNAAESVERLRLERLTAGYLTKDTENFRIKFALEDAGVIDRVASEAERQLAIVSDYFGYKSQKRITLIVYPDKEDMERGLRISSNGTTLGAFYAGTIIVISPQKWGKEGEQAEGGLYIHELTHLIMGDMAKGNYPVWFTEGMALYQEYLNTGFEWGKDYIFKNQPYTMEELTLHFNKLDQILAYKQSFLLVKAMMERNKKEQILDLFNRLKAGEKFSEAFEGSLGYPLEELENST
jgi:hypothetical protein